MTMLEKDVQATREALDRVSLNLEDAQGRYQELRQQYGQAVVDQAACRDSELDNEALGSELGIQRQRIAQLEAEYDALEAHLRELETAHSRAEAEQAAKDHAREVAAADVGLGERCADQEQVTAEFLRVVTTNLEWIQQTCQRLGIPSDQLEERYWGGLIHLLQAGLPRHRRIMNETPQPEPLHARMVKYGATFANIVNERTPRRAA